MKNKKDRKGINIYTVLRVNYTIAFEFLKSFQELIIYWITLRAHLFLGNSDVTVVESGLSPAELDFKSLGLLFGPLPGAVFIKGI